MPDKKRCAFEFAPGVRCQMVAGHDEPYYPYLDRGQYGFYSDLLSKGTAHQVLAPAPELPPRDEWTGEERRDSVESWAVFRAEDWADPHPGDPSPCCAACDRFGDDGDPWARGCGLPGCGCHNHENGRSEG